MRTLVKRCRQNHRANGCSVSVGCCSPASRERSRRVPQPLLHWGIVSSIRDRIQDFDGIGEERPQASDDKSVEIGPGSADRGNCLSRGQ